MVPNVILATPAQTQTTPSSQPPSQVAVDTKFVVKIDNKGVDYKEVANNLNARILGIDFSKGDRVVEITGTQMTP